MAVLLLLAAAPAFAAPGGPGNPVEPDTGMAAGIGSLEDALARHRQAAAETRRQVEALEERLSRLSAEYESLRQRLDTAGLDLSGEFASLLRRRLDRLESHHFDARLPASIQRQIEAARIEQFRLEELEAALPEADATPAAGRTALLTALGDAVSGHIAALNDHFAAARAMRDRIAAYQSLLRERLFWLPSAPPAGRAALTDLLRSWGWLAQPGHWRATAAGMRAAIRAHAGYLLLLTLALAGLAGGRRWIKRRLAASAANVGKVGSDRFAATLTALACTLALALPGPLLLNIAALTIAGTGAFGEALATGLVNAGLVFFLLAFLYHVARGGGLAERHFQWRAELLRAIRRGMTGLLLVLIPATVLTSLTEASIGEQYRDSLGRAVFTAASLALAWFAHRILRTVIAGLASPGARRWLRALYIGAVGAPLALAGFALYGYHYTAVRLESTLFMTACWLVAAILLHSLALRALAIRARRLALDRRREQRQAEKAMDASREAAESAGEGMPDTLDPPQMDLQAINTQTDALLRLMIGVFVAAGLLTFWSDVLPALAVLDSVVLWQVAPAVEGLGPIAVTLQDVLLALTIAALTVFAARNLPGLLEVALLSPLRLGPGSGYAITTLSTYVIVIVGVFVVLGLIGAQWSKLQWLVAALGVGLGFGLQEIVANFVSGLILLFERPIRVGDTVTVGDKTGTVSRIRIRATTLTDWDRKEQIVPNKTFVTQEVTNWTLSDAITRVIIRVGVAYGSDIEGVHRVLSDVANANEKIAKEPPPTVFCVNFGDSSVDFEVRVFVKRMLDIMPLSHEIRADIARAFREHGIEIPFPQRDIHVRTVADGFSVASPQ